MIELARLHAPNARFEVARFADAEIPPCAAIVAMGEVLNYGTLDEFYEEYSALWQHALNVRYRYKGKFKTYLQLGAALATRKVTFKAVRSGMNIAKVFSRPETFLKAHHQ